MMEEGKETCSSLRAFTKALGTFRASYRKGRAPSLDGCRNHYGVVRALRELKALGAPIPRVVAPGNDHEVCSGNRGGGFCCASNTIYVCEHPWNSCTELAYELNHSITLARGITSCRQPGRIYEGVDCGYLDESDVVCTELRSSALSTRCATVSHMPLRPCMRWHANWALRACFPNTPNPDDILDAQFARCPLSDAEGADFYRHPRWHRSQKQKSHA